MLAEQNVALCRCEMMPSGLMKQMLPVTGMMPMIRPDYWRDRFGGRSLLIWLGFIGLGLVQPFVYAAMTGSRWLYTVIQIWSVWGCFLGCVGTSASGAFTMDCLPADEDGRPLSAARDLNLLGWAPRPASRCCWPAVSTGFRATRLPLSASLSSVGLSAS